MSHEIRTPINVMLSFSSLLRERFSESDSDEELELSFSSIKNAGRRLMRTIDLLLNMSEIQIGIFEPHFRTIDLYVDCLSNLYAEYKPYADEKKLDFQIKSEIIDPFVKADEYSLNQIFSNIIHNSIKYTVKGKVEIRILRNPDFKIVAEISDTGIGISNEYKNSLFRPFSQEEQGYTRPFEGTGLGLALVKNYCEINGAKISVESEKGKGTRFTIEFSD